MLLGKGLINVVHLTMIIGDYDYSFFFFFFNEYEMLPAVSDSLEYF